MHHHDLDIILALAEGRLAPDEAQAAEAELSACAECAADLAAQRAALAFLASAPAVAMTAEESRRLRTGLAEALHIEPTPEPREVAAPRRRWFPIGAIGVAVVALLALVALGPSGRFLGGGDSLESAGADFDATTTAAAELSEDSVRTMQAPAAGDEAPASALDQGGVEGKTDVAASSLDEALPEVPNVDLDFVADAARRHGFDPAMVRAKVAGVATGEISLEPDIVANCLDTGFAELGAGDGFAVAVDPAASPPRLVALYEVDGALMVAEHTVPDCAIVTLQPQDGG